MWPNSLFTRPGKIWGGTAKLCVAERILRAGFCEEAAICMPNAFRGHYNTVPVLLDGPGDLRQEGFLVKGDLGEKDQVWRVTRSFCRKATGGGNPALRADPSLRG